MERAESEGSQCAPSDAPDSAEYDLASPALTPVAGVIIDELEGVLAGGGRDVADSLARRFADEELLERLADHSFSGAEFEVFKAELAAYGLAVMTGWIRSGAIYQQCAAKGRRLSPTGGDLEQLARSRDDQIELAGETVANALIRFHGHALLERRWRLTGGASLKTYFIGACAQAFPNVFRRWQRERRRWAENLHRAELMATDDRPLTNPAHPDLAGLAASEDDVEHLLRQLPVQTARAVILMINGATQEEAAEQVGLGPRAIEGRLRRFRDKVASAANQPAQGRDGGRME